MNSRDAEVPSTDEAAVEQRIQAAGLTAPRITPAHIDAQIREEYCFVAANAVKGTPGETSVPLQCLTICVLVLANGFTVTGESACASPENFNAQLGADIARRNARDKIWALEGYQLRTKLAERVEIPETGVTI